MSKADIKFYGSIYDPLFKKNYTRGCDRGKIAINLFKTYSQKHDLKITKVLDVGCAWGKSLKWWKRHKVPCVGVDISKTVLKYCKRMGFKCHLSSATDLSIFKDKEFDLYMSTDVYEHLRTEDLDRAIEEAKRVTKRYVLIRPHPGLDKRGKANIKDALHLTVWSLKEWRAFFEAHDLEVLKTRKNVFLMKVK